MSKSRFSSCSAESSKWPIREWESHRAAAVEEASSNGSSWTSDSPEDIRPGQKAIFRGQSDTCEVTVVGHRHTPHGLMYELASPQPGVRWTVAATQVEALYGETEMLRLDLATAAA
jgi:hypothetical protein